jgi:hypothetical protein
MAPYIVRSSGRRWSSIENSRCQSAGLALRAAAYEVLFALSGLDDDVRGAVLGVATRVPSGVWASTLLPSEGVSMRQPQVIIAVGLPSAMDKVTVLSAAESISSSSSKTFQDSSQSKATCLVY